MEKDLGLFGKVESKNISCKKWKEYIVTPQSVYFLA